MAKVLAALCDGGDGGGGDNGDGGGADTKTWLASIHKALVPYAKVLTEMGYDNFDLIRDIDAGDRDNILVALDNAEIKTVSEARLVHTVTRSYIFSFPALHTRSYLNFLPCVTHPTPKSLLLPRPPTPLLHPHARKGPPQKDREDPGRTGQ